MRSITRYRLACGLLAGIASYATLTGHRGTLAAEPVSATTARSGAVLPQARGSLRIAAQAQGLALDQLVHRALAARSVRELRPLVDRLGAEGNDATIDQLMPLLDDRPRGIAELAIFVFGDIATDHAVDVLIACAADERADVRDAAVTALGETHRTEAEPVLVEWAGRPGNSSTRRLAIAALGQLGSDTAVEVLARVAGPNSQNPYELASEAIGALGEVSSPAASAALLALLDDRDPRLVAEAITQLDEIDEPLVARLVPLTRSTNSKLVERAFEAIARAGDVALPILRQAAWERGQDARVDAVSAIGNVGTPAAIELLGDLLRTGPPDAARVAARELAEHGDARARELLIEAAKGDRAEATGALEQLSELDGDDIDEVVAGVLADGTPEQRRTVLPRLLEQGNPKALELAIDLARYSSGYARTQAMELLANAGTQPTFDALVAIAEDIHHGDRASALELLANARPGDPVVADLLADSLLSGRQDEAATAARLLAKVHSEDAEQVLIAALSGDDHEAVQQTLHAVGREPLSDPIKDALLAAARKDPSLEEDVMDQLVQAGAPEGLAIAERRLGGTDPDQAVAAVKALASEDTPEARRLIERAASSQLPEVRRQVISALSNDNDDRSADVLIQISRDSDEAVRTAAVTALGQSGSERARQVVLDAARSSSVADRRAAAEALGERSDAPARAQLVALMEDSDAGVAITAIDGIDSEGSEAQQELVRALMSRRIAADARTELARRLQRRNAKLDPATDQRIKELLAASGSEDGEDGEDGEDDDYVEDFE